MVSLFKKFISVAAVTVVAMIIVPALVPATIDMASAQLGLSDEQLGINYGMATGLPRTDVRITVAHIIQATLGVLGTLALAIVVYAGFLWMTAGGNEERVGEAKKWISAGIIGLVIILSAYSIVSFVISNLTQAVQ